MVCKNKNDLTQLVIDDLMDSVEKTINPVAIKNEIQEYMESNHHDFASLILGVFGDCSFNAKFILFFTSIYEYIVDKNQSLKQVLENINNKIDDKSKKISENTVSVSDKVVADDISNNKKISPFIRKRIFF